jgi:O-antigen/teichoic acid export membrane protein
MARANSSRGLVSALSSGLLLKGVGAVLNLLAVPIALHTLGQEKYAVFAALLGLAGWLSIGNSGLGSATGVLVSEVKDDEYRRREIFWRAAISTLLSVALVSLVAFLPFSWLSARLLSNASPGLEHELASASYYCFAVFVIIAVGATFEGLYVGLLRMEYLNRCAIVGQLAAIVALCSLPFLFPSMITLCICVTLGTTGSAIWFIIKGPFDCPPPPSFSYSFRQSLPLFREGIGFLASGLSTSFYSGASLWIIGLTFGTSELATAGVMSRLTQMYLSLLAALLIPLAPALRNALASDDRRWMRMTLGRAGMLLSGAGICAAFGLNFFGSAIISRWTGAELPALSEWLLPASTLVLVITWTYFWIYVCFAMRGSLPVAVLAVIEVILISTQFYAFGRHLAPSSSMLIMAGTMMAFSGTFLPVIVVRDLRRLKSFPYERNHSRPLAAHLGTSVEKMNAD